MTAPVLTVVPNNQPTAGQRMQRTTGQAGSVLVVIQLWQAFGWLGADAWTAEQAGLRWPALTAAGYVAVAGVQNAINWWRNERTVVSDPSSVTVTAEPAPTAPLPPAENVAA